jgi:hypothetical protein
MDVRHRTDARAAQGENQCVPAWPPSGTRVDVPLTLNKETLMNRIVYIVGAVVIIIALLSFFGLR